MVVNPCMTVCFNLRGVPVKTQYAQIFTPETQMPDHCVQKTLRYFMTKLCEFLWFFLK